MEVGDDLLDAAERKLAKLDAFLDESGWVEVGFVAEQNPRIADRFHCEIVAHVKGHRLKVEGSAGDALSALEVAAQKVDRQVRRLKDKRVKRRQRGNGSGNANRAGAFEPSTEGAGEPGGGPEIVEFAPADGKPMTPTEAALQLDLSRQDFMLFHNVESDRAAVVFRRRDGAFGLIQASI